MLKFKKNKLPEDNEDRLAYLIRFKQLLIDFHNVKGQQVKTGEMTIDKFRKFQRKWWKSRADLLCDTINECLINLTEEEIEKLMEFDEDFNIKVLKQNKIKQWKEDNTINVDITDIEEG